MSDNPPKYWGGWEGKVIAALVLTEENGISWETLLKRTGLTAFQLKSALSTLFDAHVIAKEELESDYHLADKKLGNEYADHILNTNLSKVETKCEGDEKETAKEAKEQLGEINQVENQVPSDAAYQIRWISQWRDARDLNFSLENKHFFLADQDLDEFTKQVILGAKENILVANPCLENCYLTISLEHVARRGLKVKVMTRPPDYKESNYDLKQDCHALLRSSGVSINYIEQIHSKLISVDNKIALVSSTNFYSGYSEGTSLEAGMVSLDEKTVKKVSLYIMSFSEK